MARASKLPVVALTLGLLLLAACKDKKQENPGTVPTPSEDEDTSFAEDGTDTSAADTDAQLLASSLVASSPGTIGLATVELDGADIGTRDVGDGVRAVYFPRGCVEVKAVPQEVTYTFKSCLGPNGLREVSGVVIARYTSTPTHLHLDITMNDLAVNGATIDAAASADIDAKGVERSMTWAGHLDGTSAGGRKFSHQSQYTVSWKLGEACFALEGSASGEVKSREIKTEISNFRRCRRGCPDAGGKIVVTNVAKNKQVSLEYDGTNRATFTGPNGKTSVVPLLCKP